MEDRTFVDELNWNNKLGWGNTEMAFAGGMKERENVMYPGII